MWTDVTKRASPRTAPLPGIQFCKHIEESPAWAIDYGNEFWCRPKSSSPTNSPQAPAKSHGWAALPGSIDLGDVIGRVVHAFSTNVIDPTPHVDARNYSARLGGSGLELTARVANRGKEEEFAATTFRTLSVRRGSHLAYTSSEAGLETSVLGNTCQALLEASSGLVEHYEARASDVSVTWVMPRPPEGVGPLRVEAELAGLTFADKTSTGLRFADASGHSFWRVGRVTAVDSAGRKWDVPATAKGSRLSIELPETVLANARFPLAIDPTVGPEMPIGNLVVSPKAGDQYNPVVAGSSNTFLVVWNDGNVFSTQPGQTYAARVNSAGDVLDPNGIFLSSDKGLLAVAGSGEDFLVVWKTASEDAGANTTNLRGARVGLNGSVLATYPALGNDVVKD